MDNSKVTEEHKTDIGYKRVELEVHRTNAYGWFQRETGYHRLIRISPFNRNRKRQTTFAAVNVLPIFEDVELENVHIHENEMKVTTMRCRGKGGQNVNKVESGVRLKHLPTGLQVKCVQERSQARNKEIAKTRLESQLLILERAQKQMKRKEHIQGNWKGL